MNIQPPSPVRPIVDDLSKMEQEFRTWTQRMSRLSILEGIGSPEGVVEALPTRRYMDTTGASGSVQYIKQVADIAGDKTKGWTL